MELHAGLPEAHDAWQLEKTHRAFGKNGRGGLDLEMSHWQRSWRRRGAKGLPTFRASGHLWNVWCSLTPVPGGWENGGGDGPGRRPPWCLVISAHDVPTVYATLTTSCPAVSLVWPQETQLTRPRWVLKPPALGSKC